MSDRLSGADLQRYAGWQAPRGPGLDVRAVLPVMPVVVEPLVKAEPAAPKMTLQTTEAPIGLGGILESPIQRSISVVMQPGVEYSPRPSPQPFAGLPPVR
ncbi:MAG: hypothetical protein HY430_01985 [Candidatus Levybacteria bacterium]|nr:hypothetical protein [Candidatus Levybacteria bacterium]